MKKQYLKNYKDHPFNISKVELTFLLDPKETLVRSSMSLKRTHNDIEGCELYGESLKLKKISLNNKMLSQDEYTHTDQKIELHNVPDEFNLEIETEISPENNKTLSGLYMSQGNFCTQCESHGFRRITYFIDRPDNMSEFTTHIIADKKHYPVLLGNGNCIATKDLGDKHQATWFDPSLKPSYLFALVAGDFESIKDTFTTKNGQVVNLGIFVEPGKIDQAGFAMDALKLAMKWDEDTFDRVYDLTDYNVVGVSDFNFGAMENKGLNVFNTACMLANPKTSTDNDYINVLGVIGHEYFHNWTGNRITLRNWFQLSLKEGLTVFRDQEFTADLTEPVVKRIQDVNVLRNYQFTEDAGPMSHPVRPCSYVSMNNFYTTTVYNKGAEVVRMLKTLLGDEGFKKGMDLYFDKHDGQAVTTEDFVNAHAEANEVDLDQFKLWYDQSGTPVIKVETDHNKDSGIFKVKLKQILNEKKAPKPFLIPLCIGFISDSKAINVNDAKVIQRDENYILLLDQIENDFEFEGLYDEVTISMNRGFSAPVLLQHNLSDDELIKIISKDTDMFNKWDAIQQYTYRTIQHWVEEGIENLNNQILPTAFIDALIQLMIDHKHDGRFISVCFSPVQTRTILEKMPGQDVLKIHEICQYFYMLIAKNCLEQFKKLYKISVKNKDADFYYPSISARSLKNIALFYIVKATDSTEAALAYYNRASNMTEMMGALSALNKNNSENRRHCLENFKSLFEKDALVMNKWFTLHASISDDSVHDKVRSLMKDPLFNIQNPNDARSLLGGYIANPLFHDLSVNNYLWLTDIILEMDTFNPQLASRFVQPLLQHRLYDQTRKDKMIECLNILKDKASSNDVIEVVNSGLEN
ncbi:MAG: aminopeptidase N [Pseudomonadota bacterium]|nr:aminopeptidase N [Pseudomonadota bacterium]